MLINKEQIVRTLSSYDLIEKYLSDNYQDSLIVIIDTNNAYDDGHEWLLKNLPNVDHLQDEDSVVNDYIFIEFVDLNKAIDFCNSVPNSQLYSFVYNFNQVVCTNT